MSSRRTGARFFFAAIAAVGCSSDKGVSVVDTVPQPLTCVLIGPIVSPASATIFVGDTLHVLAQANACGRPANAPPVTFLWSTSDTTIARVDSLTGLVHAKSAGAVSVIVREVQEPTVQGAMVLHVIAR
jgi:hypothetical protein